MQPEAQKNEFRLTDFHTGYKAVSYTHLDVYKRQEHFHYSFQFSSCNKLKSIRLIIVTA